MATLAYALVLVMLCSALAVRASAGRRGEGVARISVAASALTFECSIADDDVDEAAAALDRDGRFVRSYRIDAVDTSGAVCAVLETEVYMRRTRTGQKEVSAF